MAQRPGRPGGERLDVRGTGRAAQPAVGPGELSSEADGRPLWWWLEAALSAGSAESEGAATLRDDVRRRLAAIDLWDLLREVYFPPRPNSATEVLTLGLVKGGGGAYVEALYDLLVPALAAPRYRDRLIEFLDEWLPQVAPLSGYDLVRTPAQRIGLALGALAAGDGLPDRFEPMIKPYHQYPEFSDLPVEVLVKVVRSLPPQRADRLRTQATWWPVGGTVLADGDLQ